MKIAIVRLSALGDIIQSATVLQFIKKFNPNLKIHWFVDERFAGILKNHPLIDELFILPLKDKKFKKTLSILFKARRNNYSAVIDFQGLIKSALVSRILSRNAFGFDSASLKEGLAANFYNQKLNMSYGENVYMRYLSLMNYALNSGFEPRDLLHKQDVFEVNDELKTSLKNELKLDANTKNILIHTGSSELNKIYPKERVAKLCKLFCENENVRVFLCWGSEKELEFAKEVQKLSEIYGENLQILRRFSLEELITLSKIMSLIIGNDSGPTHLGFAMNRPSISIFGPTPSVRNAFKTSINCIIDAGKKNINAKHIDKSDFCIKNIDENEIYALACELLKLKESEK